MSRLCVVQARTGSTRLPGKVLADLHGRPMLAFMLARLEPLPVDHLVVATSDLPRDDAIAALCGTMSIPCVRGPEADVLRRFALALARFPSQTVVRLTADCPLVDWRLVDEGLRLRDGNGADYVSNTLVRTYPVGLDFEVLDADALRAADREASEAPEREHVTPFVTRRPRRFSLRAVRAPTDRSHVRWTVDTPEDLAVIRELVQEMEDPQASWESLLRRLPAGRRVARAALRTVQPGDPAPAGGLPVDDPATRVWTHEVDGECRGWLAVHVTDPGDAELREEWADSSSKDREQARRALVPRLGSQVRVLSIPGPEAERDLWDDLGRAGFIRVSACRWQRESALAG